MASQTEWLDTAGLLGDLRRVFGSGRTRELSWRLEQLRGIERLCDERESEIAAALAEDLGRPPVDAWLGDIASTKAEATHARKHVEGGCAALMNDFHHELAELTAAVGTERASDS